VADITKDNAQMGLTRLELSGIVAPVSTTPNRKQNKQMTITYSIWQGSSLLSVGNTATDIKEIDALIKSLNESDLAKSRKFSANVMKIEA